MGRSFEDELKRLKQVFKRIDRTKLISQRSVFSSRNRFRDGSTISPRSPFERVKESPTVKPGYY